MAWTKRTGIMLCQPLDEHNLDRNFREVAAMLAQPKLDGMRAWVYWPQVDENEPTPYPLLISSQGNPIEGVPHINLLLKDFAEKTGLYLQLDGELYRHNMEFEEIISRTKRLSDNLHADYASMQFHIFDFKGTTLNEGQRQLLLNHHFRDFCDLEPKDVSLFSNYLKRVETKLIGRRQITEYLDKWVAEGYEGIILRNPLAVYIEKRPYTILKWKPSKEDYYEIVKVIEAISQDGQALGEIGALECQDRYGNLFRVGPGLGLTQADKKQLWNDRHSLIKKFACVKYQNLTQAGIPRFGKFTLVVESSEINKEQW